MPSFTLHLNGKRFPVDADPEMPLLWALRDLLGLTGTKYGCGMGVCGACTVHEDGVAVRSCQIPLSASAGKEYVSIEGLSSDGSHPCQKAWVEEDVSQCGYCQVGMVMQAAAFLRHKPNPSAEEVDAEMSDHICRCGTYQRMRKAILRAASEGRKA